MDETANVSAVETAETPAAESAYSEWDVDVDALISEYNGAEDETVVPAETTETPETTGPESETEHEDDAHNTTDAGEGEQAQPAAESEPETFTLKHLDEVRTVGRDEVITLAQKGMDYDRVRSKYDASTEELKGIKDWFNQYTGGRTFEDFRDSVEANRIARQLGIDKATALERLKLDRERKALDAEKEKAAQADSAAEASRRKAQEDVAEFAKRYPEAAAKLATDKSAIPQEVWDAVRRGERLVDAYSAYTSKQEAKAKDRRIKELEAQLRAKEQESTNKKNAARSTGSQSSAGEDDSTDLIKLGWYSAV